MATICGAKARVTLEIDDGTVISGPVHVAQIEESRLGDWTEWRMELMGLGDAPIWSGRREQAIERQREVQSAIEWACDYCGAVWPKATAQCVQCGGWRSFVYDV